MATYTNWDDLSVRDFIVISDAKEEDDSPQVEFGMWGMPQQRSNPRSLLNLRPLKILHIELPFLIVTDGEHKCPVDLRLYHVRKVSKRYVALLEEEDERISPIGRRGPRKKSKLLPPKKKKKEKPDKRTCARCGEKMTLTRVERKEGWFYICPRCNISFGEAEIGDL